MFEIEAKNALVTGGASGIGLAIVTQLLKSKISKVVIFDIDKENGEREEKVLNKQYGQERVIFKRVDIGNGPQFEDAFDAIMKQIDTLDILVNNAGMFNDKRWELEFSVNLNGMFRGTILGLKYMGKDEGRNGGVIVNVSSLAAIESFPLFPGYSATKAGIMHASRAFGDECHYKRNGVRVLVLCPGATDTNMIKSRDADERSLSPAYNELLKEMTPKLTLQSSESAGIAAIDIIQKAPTATVWVTECDEPAYELEFKSYTEMRKQ